MSNVNMFLQRWPNSYHLSRTIAIVSLQFRALQLKVKDELKEILVTLLSQPTMRVKGK